MTRSEFRINDAPESISRDRRYAHSLYIDFLLLLEELSGYSVKSGRPAPSLDLNPKLAANKVAKALAADDTLKGVILRETSRVAMFDPILKRLLDKIQTSKIFVDYLKIQKKTLADDVRLWVVIFETIIDKNPEIEAILREQGDFSSHGYKLAVAQVCDTLKSYADSTEQLLKAKRDLAASLDKAYELYLWLFQLIIDITAEQARRLEAAKSKHLASSADLNPNTRLIDNKLVDYLLGHETFQDLLKEYKVAPIQAPSAFLKGLLDQIVESDLYKAYIENEDRTLEVDAEFWRDALRMIVLPSDLLAEELEDKSVYWNDDLQIMGTFVLKTIRQIAQGDGKEIEILPKFKDIEDEKFGPELFMYAVENMETYRGYIDQFIQRSQWDPERLAFMDIVIMVCAVAEIINFPKIPVPVSVNEYVDIANSYSTDKSGGFVNGVLYSVVRYLSEEGIIEKPITSVK
ncbi:MAG: transcription antitermination protein NusB [Clostridium sp.]|nr:transcription antitermination protein NusB [Clostridium sp.]